VNAPTSQQELQLLLDGGFDAVGFWSTRPVKIWVVEVSRRINYETRTHMMYVRSRTRDGAEQCARENTFIRGNVSARARLATPRDLGCVPTGATQ
jgi:hypothetical protein